MTEVIHPIEQRDDEGGFEDTIDDRTNWEKITDRWRSLKRWQQVVTASGLVISIAAGLSGGRFLLRDDAEATPLLPPRGDVAVGPPAGDPVAPDNPGVAGTTWSATCTDVFVQPKGGTRFNLLPVFQTTAGPADPNGLFTVVSYDVTDAYEQQNEAAPGLKPITIDIAKTVGFVQMAGVYFPDPNNRPASAEEIPPAPEFGLQYPDAVIVPCDLLSPTPDGNPTTLERF